MIEGKEIQTINVAGSEKIVFGKPVQRLELVCYSGTLYVNWRGVASEAGADCLKMVEKSSYTIGTDKPFLELNIVGTGELGVVMI